MRINRSFLNFLLTILPVWFAMYAQAQRRIPPNLLLEARTSYGFLINHHLEMRIFNAHFPAFEINIGKETNGSRTWQTKYDYPVIGVSYWYSHLGNSTVLGSAHAVFPYVNYPLVRMGRSQLNFRLGVGLSYITKPFDPISNYKYIAIGSHINCAIHFSTEYRYQVTQRLNMSAGFSAMHCSNGSIKTPNYGINAVFTGISAAYRLNKLDEKVNIRLRPGLYKFEFPEKKSMYFAAGGVVAIKDMGSEIGRNFMIYNFFVNAMKPVSFKSNLGLEFNVTRNMSDIYMVKRDSLDIPSRGNVRLALAPMYELKTGDLTYDFGLGFYMNKIVIPAFAYFKVGFKYMVTPNIFATLALHTHLGQADFVGVGVGYKIHQFYSGKK